MKKYTLFWLGLLMISLASTQAQMPKVNRSNIGISLGLQEIKFLDEHASPLLYKASSFPVIGAHYTHNTPGSYFNVKLSGGTGSADPQRFGARNYITRWSDKDSFQYQISSMFIQASLEATYLKKLNPSSTGPLGYWLGGTASDQAYYADEVANFNWLINTAELSPVFKMDFQHNSRHEFSFKVDLTALALITRSVYGLFPKSNKDKNVIAFFKQGTRLKMVSCRAAGRNT